MITEKKNVVSKPETRESFTCLCSILDGFVYRPSTKEEAEEIQDSLREIKP